MMQTGADFKTAMAQAGILYRRWTTEPKKDRTEFEKGREMQREICAGELEDSIYANRIQMVQCTHYDQNFTDPFVGITDRVAVEKEIKKTGRWTCTENFRHEVTDRKES